MNAGAKKQLIQSGIFTGAILIFFLILSLFSFLSRKNWERGLRAAVEQVLSPEEYQCGNAVKINSTFNVSAACFELATKKQSSKNSYALIIRIASYLGPLPAVFICQDGKTEFKGIAYLNSSMARAFEDGKNDQQNLYWKKIAEELAREIKGNGAKK